MNKGSKIVRTKTIIGNKNNPSEMYYQIDFMIFSKYILKKNDGFKFYNQIFELYPYKWFDLRWVFEIISYWLLLRIFRNSPERISRQMHNKTSTATLIIEILLTTKLVIEIAKLFMCK